MSEISYSYQIVAVDVAARCMEVVYTADGYPTQHIGARLPYDGESVEDIVRTFAPVAYWQETQKTVVPPAVGVSGSVVPQPVTPEQIQAEIVQATQARLDAFARIKNYDGILSACTYATSTNPTFQAEGQFCVQARDNTWAALYSILAEVQAGTRPMPTGFADVEGDLPVLDWANLV